ncbi:hypothetical protein SB48_HM08orf01081 [Heyndrickxia coagulans]|uniref:Uncharacterized protein n=1 Tax=Heyndrickxia coagulans TaxID=1398 RepID=A0AAN0T3U5_HEYCO|nr:hypothetical protein SB48_HM08orf01081 [Heyndrickxia coagulans]
MFPLSNTLMPYKKQEVCQLERGEKQHVRVGKGGFVSRFP